MVGLEGDDCDNESAEKCEAEAGGQHDVARRKGGFELGFGFLGHGFGFGGWVGINFGRRCGSFCHILLQKYL